MISIRGRSVVLAALLLATVGAVISFAAAQRNAAGGVVRARRLAYLYAAMMALATGLMIFALVSHDFSVSYVAQVGSLATPLHITIVSLWSSLDGSILFWGLILGAFTAGSAFHLRRSAPDQVGYMLGTLFVVGIFFTFLIAGPADPFAPTPLPIPTDGPGPNPLLQNHPLMIIHPPMLYLGYVGMSVPFAIALAALFAGRLDRDWIRSLRTWLLVPTGFLTMGVMLGGWWSYEVLGWGGYWAWDPVENASFLPWLTAILDGRAGGGDLPAHHSRHLPHPLRGRQLGALLHPDADRTGLPRLPRFLPGGVGRGLGHAHGHARLGSRPRDPVDARGRLPDQQPAAARLHVHRAGGHALSDRRRAGARRQGERRRAVLQPHATSSGTTRTWAARAKARISSAKRSAGEHGATAPISRTSA